MEIDKIMEAGMQAFRQKFKAFCEEKDFVKLSPESSEAIISGLKSALAASGIAALKSYLEAHDSQKDILVVGDVVYRFKCLSPKEYLTPFGEVEICRRLYQPDRGGDCYAPLDHYWGMANEYATVDVRESVLYSVVHNTPEETVRLLEKCSLFHPSATAVKHIVAKTGAFFELHHESFQERILSKEKIPTETKAVVVSLDGVNVLLNERGKGRGRPAERPQSSDAAGHLSHYRNAMVGSISFYGEATEDGPVRLESRYVARMPEEKAVLFKKDTEKEVASILSKCPTNIRKVLLMDGQRSLWNYTQAVTLYSEFEPLIDFYHTTEHLSRASEALFGKGVPKGFAWYESCRIKLLEEKDAALSIIRSMDYYVKVNRLSKARKKELKVERTFFIRQKHLMKYPEFRRKGLPIGSGPVEAACKSLVKTRLGRSGMRWSITGGQNILTLRTLVKSGRWECGWKIYKSLKMAA